MTSLKDVAKLAGVAVGTVSRYLNEPERLRESTRQKIEPAIKALGYSPNSVARSLRRGKTGLVMVTCSAIGDPYFGDVIRGIDRAAQRHGFAVLVKEVPSVRWSSEMVRDIILSRAADGVIVLGSISPFDLEAGADKEVRYPPVVVGAEIVSTAMQRLPSVRIDNVAAAEELTRFLVGLGHRRIAFMTGEQGSAHDGRSRDRLPQRSRGAWHPYSTRALCLWRSHHRWRPQGDTDADEPARPADGDRLRQ